MYIIYNSSITYLPCHANVVYERPIYMQSQNVCAFTLALQTIWNWDNNLIFPAHWQIRSAPLNLSTKLPLFLQYRSQESKVTQEIIVWKSCRNDAKGLRCINGLKNTVTKLVLVLFSTGRNLKFSWISRKRRHEILCFFSNLIRNKTFWWWAILPWTIFLEIKLCKHNAIFGHGIRHKKSVEKNKKILSLGHLLFLSLWQCYGKTDLVKIDCFSFDYK